MTITEVGDELRVFPPINAEMYRAVTADGDPSRTTWALLSLADEPLSFMARYLDRDVTPRRRVGRALSLHRDAMAAELAGQCERADFFWRQLHTEVGRFGAAEWAAAREAAGVSFAGLAHDADAVRERLVQELFVGTHLAFYRGYVATAGTLTLASRAFEHFRYAARWLARAGLREAELLPLLATPAATIVALGSDAKNWSPAVDACELVLTYCPGTFRFQERLARLHWDRAMSGITSGSEGSAALQDAKHLLIAIQHIEALLGRYPDCAPAYDYAANLYHIRAVKLANGGPLSQALCDCEKALAYDPGFDDAQESKSALIEAMQKLQEHVKAVIADLATKPNAHLNAKGEELRDEANAGFTPAMDYRNSAARTETLKRAYRARTRRLWHRIGLSEPAAEFDWQARLLYETLGHVLSAEPTDRPAILREIAAVETRPDLTGPQWNAVLAFVEQQRGLADAPPAVDDLPALPAGPSLVPETTTVTPGGEPFAYWLVSGQDRRIKVQAAAAVVILALGIGLVGREVSARHSRDVAYAQLGTAARDQQHLKVIENAEQFLDHQPLSGSDARQDEVVTLFGEALVRWVAVQPGEISADAMTHAERYRQLTAGASRPSDSTTTGR